MPELLDLSNELLHLIFSFTQAEDLARLSQTCHQLHGLINGNDLLWKEVYLGVFVRLEIAYHGLWLIASQDDPKQQSWTVSSWQSELSWLWRLHKILLSEDEQTKTRNMEFVTDSITQLLQQSSPEPGSKTRDWLRGHFENHLNYHSLMCKSTLHREAFSERTREREAIRKKTDQLSAKLHVLHGVYCECSKHKWNPGDGYPALDACARSRVYDLRRWNDRNSWGPFMDNNSKRVDWVKMSCIMVVLLSEKRRFCKAFGSTYLPLWHLPFAGAAPNTYRELDHRLEPQSSHPDAPMLKQPELSLEQQDPYGVAGTWNRMILFLDYSDLWNFNFNSPRIPDSMPRPPLEESEAVRFLVVRLHVTKIEPVIRDEREMLPLVYFEGDSRVHEEFGTILGSNSTIKGHVRQNPEGEIWWTTVSTIDGEERWKSECIQVGGLRSERGLLGTWFDKDYADGGPVGPTCFWKVSDKQLDKNVPSVMRREKPEQPGWRRYG